MKSVLFIAINILCISITSAQSLEINLSSRDQIFDTSFTIFLTAKNQSYLASAHIKEKGLSFIVFYKNIISDDKRRNDTLNIIPLHPNYMWWFTGETFNLFTFKDINLDTYDDLFVLCGIDDHYGSPSYEIWLYDKNEGRYRYSDDFSEKVYSHYVLDKKKKTITSNWTGSNDYNENGSLTYKIDGEKLELIEEISLISDMNGKYIWKQEKLINGKLEVVKQILKTYEQVERGE